MKTIKTYYAYFGANNAFNSKAYKYTNKAKAIKEIRAIAKGNHLAGDFAEWYVKDESGQIIASGTITPSGQNVRTEKHL